MVKIEAILCNMILFGIIQAFSPKTIENLQIFVENYNKRRFAGIYYHLSEQWQSSYPLEYLSSYYKSVFYYFGQIQELSYSETNAYVSFKKNEGFAQLTIHQGTRLTRDTDALIIFSKIGSIHTFSEEIKFIFSAVITINQDKFAISQKDAKYPIGSLINIPILSEVAKQLKLGNISEYDTVLKQDIQMYHMGPYDSNFQSIPFDSDQSILLVDLIRFQIQNPTLAIQEYLIDLLGPQNVLETSQSLYLNLDLILYPSSWIVALATNNNKNATNIEYYQSSLKIHDMLKNNSDQTSTLLDQTSKKLGDKSFSKKISKWSQKVSAEDLSTAFFFLRYVLDEDLLNIIQGFTNDFDFLQSSLLHPQPSITFESKSQRYESARYYGFSALGWIEDIGDYTINIGLSEIQRNIPIEECQTFIQTFYTLFTQSQSFRTGFIKKLQKLGTSN